MNHNNAIKKISKREKIDIPNDYVVYLQELDFDIEINKDPISFSQVINSDEFDKLLSTMKDG